MPWPKSDTLRRADEYSGRGIQTDAAWDARVIATAASRAGALYHRTRANDASKIARRSLGPQ